MNPTQNPYAIGTFGLGAMGSRIAARIAQCGHSVVGYDRDDAQRQNFESVCAELGNLSISATLSEFCNCLARPRRILLMVPSGAALDSCIQDLLASLDPGDVLLDGGNSHFEDTVRHAQDLKTKDIGFIGMGVSGGVEVERTGPCIMAGGTRDSWESVRPIFEAIAAPLPGGRPACAFVGPGGSGHYVKMVHNGIEYAEMQLIAEAYWLLHTIYGLNSSALQAVFRRWNEGPLKSYLVESTARILSVASEDSSEPIVDKILDRAGQKGTGRWTIQSALELGVPVPTLAEAVFARSISVLMAERETTAARYRLTESGTVPDQDMFVGNLESALHASRLCVAAQGIHLMREASETYEWDLDLAAIAGLWQAGCIITSDMMGKVEAALRVSSEDTNLLANPQFTEEFQAASQGWRRIVQTAIQHGVSTPALNSALQYFDAYRSAKSPANLIQAQRDFFGRHGVEWVDGAPGELHNIDWWKNSV